jgi:hypothetical protein
MHFHVCAAQRPHAGMLGKQIFVARASRRAMETPRLRHSMFRVPWGDGSTRDKVGFAGVYKDGEVNGLKVFGIIGFRSSITFTLIF